MKKRFFALLLILCLVISLCPKIDSEAKGTVINAATVYVDEGESIFTGTSYNNNFLNLSSSDNTVAVGQFDQTTGKLTLSGKKKGTADITLRLGTANDYKDYIYTVEVLNTFCGNNVSYTYDYNKVTVNYDASTIPSGCTPVFSIDGKTWSESNTITRDKTNDGVIYKAFKINGVVTGSIKKLGFNTKKYNFPTTVNEDVTMKIGEEKCVASDFSAEHYKYYAITGETNVSFDESTYTIKAKSEGRTIVSVETGYETDFTTDGSYTVFQYTYNYYVEVEGDKKEDTSDYDGANAGSQGGNGSYDNHSDEIPLTDESQFVSGSWHYNGIGWWYEEQSGIISSYPMNTWKKIDNTWYYFNASGYMESGCYRYGCWLNYDGSWNPSYSNGTWKCNSVGWWYEDSGWYPTSQWLMIDGYWYYFKANGYMACNEYIDGYWLGADGAWR